MNGEGPEENAVILRLDTACRALAEAKTIDRVKLIRDQAAAFRQYARERDYGLRAINDAAEIKLRAERRLGNLLAEMPKNKGVRLGGNAVLPPDGTPRLADLGIGKMNSHRWQRIADIPEKDFDAHILRVRETEDELTTAGVLRLSRQLQQPGKQEVEPVEDGCQTADLETLTAAGKTFGTIYADPPWQYGNQSTRAATDNHYKTMTVDAIAGLPVQLLSRRDAHLHLWTTNAFLFDAKRVMDAWGFEYRSVFVWCKPQFGIGNYWRVSHEFLLLGIRGNAKKFADRSLRSWAEIDRAEHSGKPEKVRLMVERASPGPRLELFGRQCVKGWTVWGNEIRRDLFAQGGAGE